MSPSSAGDKTERATPKKRRDARKRGQVLKSTEVNTAFCCVVMFAFMMFFAPSLLQGLSELIRVSLSTTLADYMNVELSITLLQELFVQVSLAVAGVILPILLCALLSGLLINVLQVGFLFTPSALQPKLERINPLKGFKRIFSARTVAELLKSILKITLLTYVCYKDYQTLVFQVPSLLGGDVYSTFLEILRMAFSLALKMSLIIALLAIFDYLFQWWSYEKDLRMTKQEVKDEYKLTEGDPQIKGRIRQKQRQMSAMRMMQQVPGADVVITNPTHFAIALRYEQGRDAAPMVLAKGQDFLARKIKEVAKEHHIEIVENKPLARSLYLLCEVGSEIPPEFYQAVADILVYIYRQKRGGKR